MSTFLASADTALLAAVKQADVETLQGVLEEGAEVNALASDGATALHWATHLDHTAMAAALMKAGSDVNARNRFGVTPLMLASTNGSAAVAELLLDGGADPNLARPGGETPLMLASRTGEPETVRLLLAHGADANAREDWKAQTALMWAAAEGHDAVVRALLEAGAERDVRSGGGYTAFLFAARQGHRDVVQTLLKNGASVDEYVYREDDGDDVWDDDDDEEEEDGLDHGAPGPSAMGLAAMNAHYSSAADLLDAGADPNFRWEGRSALHVITRVRRPGTGANSPGPPGSGEMDSLEFVRALVAHGADVNLRMTRGAEIRSLLNTMGATPFLLAARTADAALMQLLADLGADPTIPNEDNTTPLHAAAGVGVQSPGEDPGTPSEVFAAVKVAVTLGNDVNAVDDNGESVMHGVAYKYAADAVDYLMAHGAQIEVWNQKNDIGWTPLRIADGVHRTMNLRKSPETAAEIRDVLAAAGYSTEVEAETNISGATN
jgi:ankyrin repeat protein